MVAMYLKKTRAVPISKEKKVDKSESKYFTPTCYSARGKTSRNESAYFKEEDFL